MCVYTRGQDKHKSHAYCRLLNRFGRVVCAYRGRRLLKNISSEEQW